MRIGFDISQTGDGKAGCGFFADGLIRQLLTIQPKREAFGPKSRRSISLARQKNSWVSSGSGNLPSE